MISGQRYQRSDLCRSCLCSYFVDLHLRQIQHQADQEEAGPGEGSQGDRQLGCGRWGRQQRVKNDPQFMDGSLIEYQNKNITKNKLCWECHTRDLRFKIQDNLQTHCIKFQDTPDSECSKFNKKNPYGGWVGGWFFQEIIPLRGSILQAGTCQILS